MRRAGSCPALLVHRRRGRYFLSVQGFALARTRLTDAVLNGYSRHGRDDEVAARVGQVRDSTTGARMRRFAATVLLMALALLVRAQSAAAEPTDSPSCRVVRLSDVG